MSSFVSSKNVRNWKTYETCHFPPIYCKETEIGLQQNQHRFLDDLMIRDVAINMRIFIIICKKKFHLKKKKRDYSVQGYEGTRKKNIFLKKLSEFLIITTYAAFLRVSARVLI